MALTTDKGVDLHGLITALRPPPVDADGRDGGWTLHGPTWLPGLASVRPDTWQWQLLTRYGDGWAAVATVTTDTDGLVIDVTPAAGLPSAAADVVAVAQAGGIWRTGLS